MKTITINNIEYDIEKDYKNGFNEEEAAEKITDYFSDFDYIFGDYSYGKLRLKGFCNNDNSLFRELNDISTIEKYIKEICSHECAYFLLKKTIKNTKK